jgi:tetratricopeptide (TPR) repeat protein
MRARLSAVLAVAAAIGGVDLGRADDQARIETGFHRMYELRFDEARAEILAYRSERPNDPLGAVAEAASYLFEEFDREGVLTSEFFLDDDRFLGGITGTPNPERRTAFLAANDRAREMARKRLESNPADPDGLFALTLADGMQGDFEAVIEKRQLSALGSIRRAEQEAKRLLAVRADAQDAYVALGAANYIIGCLPAYKRFFLWFGGVRGDRQRGMEQLQMAAERGHYLRPLAKAFLALAAEREGQFDRALALFQDLAREFPANPVFAREAALAQTRAAEAGAPTPAR